MAVSAPVRAYYATRIFAQTTRDLPPPNFRPLDVPVSGRAVVEGCRGGGKNVLEVELLVADGIVADVRMLCGLCNPAMYVAADLVADWSRGRALSEVLSLDALSRADLAPLYAGLGDPRRPDDLREKLQYALLALQRAVHDARGTAPGPLPDVPEPRDRDDADDEEDEVGSASP